MGTILVVVQDADIRALLEVALETHGHELTVPTGHDAALDLLAAGTFDLVVLDDDDQPSGLHLARRLCGGDRPRPPVLMLTNRGSHQALGLGPVTCVDHYVLKPFRVDQLVDAVHLTLVAGSN